MIMKLVAGFGNYHAEKASEWSDWRSWIVPPGMPMKKKTVMAPRNASKGSNSAVGKPRPARGAKRPTLDPRSSLAPQDAQPTIRRLRTQLTRALSRIEELQAS